MRSLVIWLCLCVDVSEGWGKVGHEIVGNLAYELLSKEAKSAVDDLLDVEVLKESETTMGAVASWADKVRFTSEFHWTTPLHYVDIRDVDMKDGCVSPEKCHFEYKRDCTHDMCAVAAISDISSLLTSHLRGKSQLNKITKKQALKFLIHFIGDIHQPLHVSRQSDRGGNEIHVSLPIKTTKVLYHERDGTIIPQANLHSVWDDLMIDYALSRQEVLPHHKNQQKRIMLFQKSIQNKFLTPHFISHVACKKVRGNVTCPSLWAQESLHLALTEAYEDEHGAQIISGTKLSMEYYTSRLEIIQQQLATAAVRLANTLEAIYGDPDHIILETRSQTLALL